MLVNVGAGQQGLRTALAMGKVIGGGCAGLSPGRLNASLAWDLMESLVGLDAEARRIGKADDQANWCDEPSGGRWSPRLAKGSGAGEGDRTLVLSLGSFCSTIELHPRGNVFYAGLAWVGKQMASCLAAYFRWLAIWPLCRCIAS